MKRDRLNLLLGGSVTIVFSVAGILAPGCEAALRDPQAFFADTPCNLLNCDTLFFLDGGRDQPSDATDAAAPDASQ